MKKCWKNSGSVYLCKRVIMLLSVLFIYLNAYGSKTFYLEVTATAQPTGSGKVYVATDKQDLTNIGGWSNSHSATNSATVGQSNNNDTVSLWVHAKPELGYYFANWNVDNYATENPHEVKEVSTSEDEKNPTKVNDIKALFKPIEVTSGYDNNTRILTKDLGGTGTGTVTFDVNAANSAEGQDFNATVNGLGYSVESMSCDVTNRIVTVTIKYTDQDIHGDVSNATVTLTSKGKDDKGVKSHATATIGAHSDLTPTFAMPSSFDFGEIYSMASKGSGTSLYMSSPNAVASNYKTIWTATIIEGDDAAFFATTLNPTNGQCVVTYKPQAVGTHTATLKLYATYTDSKGKAIKSEEVETTLTGKAKIPLESKIEFTPASVNFASVTHQEKHEDVTVSIQNTSDVTYSFGSTNASGVFSYEVSDGSVRVSVLPTYPGNFNAILTASGKDSRDGHSGETTEASLPIQVNVGLAAPTLKGSSNSRDTYFLVWDKIRLGEDYGAVEYKIYEVTNGTDKVEISGAVPLDIDEKHMGVKIASTAASKVYIVEALVEYNSISYTAWSNQISLTLNTLNSNIVDFYDVYTGTECPSETFPYKPKRKINLSACFDSNGEPLFDKLYIFGLTSNTNDATYTYKGQVYPRINTPTNPDNATTCFNATTPLYVYNKVQGGYQLERTLDATKDRFDHDTSLSGKKIYISGYCPFAYMGTTTNEEGWMYFQGKNEDVVDIYLDNCEIRGKYKTENGCDRANDYKDYTVKLAVSIKTFTGTEYLYGSSSPFVFKSNSGASEKGFTPRIHIKNNNLLVGQYGMRIKKVVGTVDVGIGGNIGELPTDIGNINQASAAVAIRPESKGPTNLTFDDNWVDGSITNGYLKLTSTTGQIGSIDLGNEMGSVTFNGGQYCVRNASADGNYTCNMMASMRAFTKEAQKDLPVLGTVTAVITLYGFGGDVPGNCKVTINSGTFTLEKNAFYCKEYYRDQENFMDLRLPWASKVNGGTFNGISHVVACKEATTQGTNPLNSLGYPLCLREDIVPLEQKTAYGSVSFDFNDESLGGLNYEDAYSQSTPSVDIRSGLNPETYGGQSLNPDEEGKLNLLLPAEITDETGSAWCDIWDNTLIRQWATCIPLFDVEKNGQSASVGGDVTVYDGLIEENQYKTNQLLYIEVDDVMLNTILEGDGMNILVKTKRANILNTKEYTIHKHQNLLKPIEADQWITIVAPFNVHDISVLEATAAKETDLEAMTREEAHKAQATAFLNFYNDISGFVLPKSDGRTTAKPLTTLMEWYGVKPYKLIHYNGANIREAHYYLYELDNLNDGFFSTNATGEELNITWKPVETPLENEPILEKGHVYAMQFPYCPLCNDVDTTEYDYWTGKYILLHGLGTQDVDGTNTHDTLLTNTLPQAGSAILKGNTSLNALTLPASTGYIHNTTNDLFELNESNYSVKPMETFMLYNPPLTARMPKAISRAGKVIYEEQTATGLPTIGDRTTLNAYANNMQIHLTALQAQHAVIYDMHGQVLYDGQLMEGEQMSISAPQGIYIVKGTYEIIKLIVD